MPATAGADRGRRSPPLRRPRSLSASRARGAVDILARHARTRTVLVIELKTDIVDVQEMLGTLDRKRRLARSIARAHGWEPAIVATRLIVAPSLTNRRQVEAHRTMLRNALPDDGRSMAAWLASPRGPIAAHTFWPANDAARATPTLAPARRVRRQRGV